jgi:hypothetical protein
MAHKKKTSKKKSGETKRKVGAVAIKRRGAKARLRSALRARKAAGEKGSDRPDAAPDGGVKKIKTHFSRFKSRSRALAAKLTRSQGSRKRKTAKTGK